MTSSAEELFYEDVKFVIEREELGEEMRLSIETQSSVADRTSFRSLFPVIPPLQFLVSIIPKATFILI